MSEHIYLLTISLPLAAMLLVFGMKYLATVQQAKARLAQEGGHRELAARAVAAQADTAQALARVADTLADVQRRVAAVEKVLKEVE